MIYSNRKNAFYTISVLFCAVIIQWGILYNTIYRYGVADSVEHIHKDTDMCLLMDGCPHRCPHHGVDESAHKDSQIKCGCDHHYSFYSVEMPFLSYIGSKLIPHLLLSSRMRDIFNPYNNNISDPPDKPPRIF